MIQNQYRRGAVLGLTVAEIFILLTFLLLFALLGFLSGNEADGDERTQHENKVPAPIPWIRPEQYEALVNRAESLRQELNQAKKELSVAKREANAAIISKIDAELEHGKAESELSSIERKLQAAEQTVETLNRELYVQKKGDQPACWYTMVPEDGGRHREKREYIFYAAIFENGIALDSTPPPEGGADDDNGGSYFDEWQKLNVSNLPYNQKLNENEFLEAVKHIADKGRNREVRTYACVFTVKVWDMTPENAKERWKNALKFIQNSFSTFVPDDERWTGIID